MTTTQHYSDCKTTSSPTLAACRPGFVSPLARFELLAFSGAHAVAFLHRQLTNDVEHLPASQARLAAYCTPQGRLLATFLFWRNADSVIMQLPQEILPGLHKRLKLYVLRDKVNITALDAFAQLGLGGHAATTALAPWFATLPEKPYDKVEGEHGTLIRVADAFASPRYLWILPGAMLAQVWPALIATLEPCVDAAWGLADIDAGIPVITPPTQEKFVAQMLNFELIDGVSFKKGCYPGQEIVARLQHRGKTPRRMLGASILCSEGDVVSGTEVYAQDDPDQPCGMIVNAERSAPDRIACLVSLRYPMAEGTIVHLGSISGPVLQFVPLPYAIEDTD